jgi:cytochrome b involved in lipid metabolism
MGYDMPIFGQIKQYVYGPYIAFVVLCFMIAEFRRHRRGNVANAMSLHGRLWGDDDSKLEHMTMQAFLDVTRIGAALCVVDGRVLDVTDFIDNHPGGPELLRYVKGSDITGELLGERDVDGLRHVHSHGALKLLKKYVVAQLVTEDDSRGTSGNSSELIKVHRPTTSVMSHVYRRGKVVDVKYVTPRMSISESSKPVILMRIALPRDKGRNSSTNITSLPGCAFSYRGIDERGTIFERQYTPINLERDWKSGKQIRPSLQLFDDRRSQKYFGGNNDDSMDLDPSQTTGYDNDDGDEYFDFVISLIPGGKMSKFLHGLRTGKVLLAQGPKTNPSVLNKINSQNWTTVVMIAAGTGIAPMLQLIDSFLSKGSCPAIYLIWILKTPEHSFQESIGLDSRVHRSRGLFRFVTVYSSHMEARGGGARRASVLSRMSVDVASVSPIDLGFSRAAAMKMRLHTSIKYGILKRNAKLNVKDLIAMARLEICNQSSTGQIVPEQDSAVFDFASNAWNGTNQAIRKQFEKGFLLELLVSAREHASSVRCRPHLDDVDEDDVSSVDDEGGEGDDDVSEQLHQNTGKMDGPLQSTHSTPTAELLLEDSAPGVNPMSPCDEIDTDSDGSVDVAPPPMSRAVSDGVVPRMTLGLCKVTNRSPMGFTAAGRTTYVGEVDDLEMGFARKGGVPLKVTNDSTFQEQNLTNVAVQFQMGVTTGRHKYRLRNYDNTFVGRVAVTYMVENGMAPTRQDAVFLGKRLMREMLLFSHVTREHDFEDEYLFYRYEEGSATSSINGSQTVVPDPKESDFPAMLVAISGSPNFEMDILQTLHEIGLSKKQTLSFVAATTPLQL